MKPNVRIKTAQEMGLTNEVAVFEDGLRTGSQSGNYEWWYTDCKFPDGSSLVVIFFSKPITSMANKFQPYVSFDFLSPTHKHIHTEYKCDDYSLCKEHCDVRIGDCYIKGDLSHYDIYSKMKRLRRKSHSTVACRLGVRIRGICTLTKKNILLGYRLFPKSL